MKENQIEFLDLINLISFVVGIMNYQENLTQGDKQDIMNNTDQRTEALLKILQKEIKEQNEILENLTQSIKRLERN